MGIAGSAQSVAPDERRSRKLRRRSQVNASVLRDHYLHVLHGQQAAQHPHIHVRYQEHEVIVAIPDGEVLEGNIPNSRMKLFQAWIELHKDELVADWELAVSGQQPYKIDPLR
jgi:hypothetical protein